MAETPVAMPPTRRFLVTITPAGRRRPLDASTVAYALTGRTRTANADHDYVHVLDLDVSEANTQAAIARTRR